MASDDVQILRVTGDDGDCIVFACLTSKARCSMEIASLGALSDLHGSPSVVCDCSALVQLTDPRTLMAMSGWIMSAATWLKEQQDRDTEVDR